MTRIGSNTSIPVRPQSGSTAANKAENVAKPSEGATPASAPTDTSKHPPISADAPASTATEETATAATARFRADPHANHLEHHLHGGREAQQEVHGHGDGAPVVTGGISGTESTTTFDTVSEATTALQNDFGVSARNGTGRWTAGQLTEAHRSFSRMSATERRNLQGLDLVRDREPSAEMAGEHNHDHGELAGFYDPNVTTQNGTRVSPPAIHMFDSAFPTGGTAEQNRAATQNVFLHEAGHAVEGEPRNNATAARNAVVDRLNPAVGRLNDANDARNALVEDYNAAGNAAGAVRTPRTDTAWRSYMGASNRVNSRITTLSQASTESARAAAQTRLDTAIQQRDTAFDALPADHTGHDAASAFRESQNGFAQSTTTYAEARVEEQAVRAELTSADRTLAGVQRGNPPTSNRLAAFNTMRAGSNENAVSDYGATAPAEDYAEAYALFRRDPEHMQANFPRTYRFFNEGRHAR